MCDEALREYALSVERDPARHRTTIVLDDAERRNTIPFPARAVLARLFAALSDDRQTRVVVIRGAGTDAFSAGGNIAQFMEADPEELADLAWNVGAPERCAKPVIAQLQGFTFGVGLELALACDFRVAATTTVVALPEIKLGMIPGSGGSQRVAAIAGLGRAKDMAMRGRRIPALEAHAWGLLTSVHSPAELDQAVADLVAELAARPQRRFGRSSACSTVRTMRHCTLQWTSKVVSTRGCARRPTSPRAYEHSAKSDRRTSQASMSPRPLEATNRT